MDKKTEEILKKDSIADVEKITGKHWSEFDEAENILMLLHAFSDNQVAAEHLKEIGDTYSAMTWIEFKNLLVAKGMAEAYSYKFKKYDFEDEAVLYYHSVKGWILFAESYRGKSVNSGKLYLEMKANSDEDEKELFYRLGSGGRIDGTKGMIASDHDIREGLFSKVEDMESFGTYLNPWFSKSRFLWFKDYSEDGDYKKATQSKIDKCSEEFRKIIGR
jgi:hypothetical protein